MRRLAWLWLAACATPPAPVAPPGVTPPAGSLVPPVAPPAAPPVTARNAAEAAREAERIAALTRGKTLEGSVVAHLEQFPGVAFPVARGRCYTVVYRLASNAEPGNVAIRFAMETGDQKTLGRNRLTKDTRPFGAGGNCPHTDGMLRVDLDDYYRMNIVHDGGRGDITLELYSEPTDLPALDRKWEATERAIRRAESLPADCEDCDFNCRSTGTACEHRCFVDHQNSRAWGRDGCNETCTQITRACQSGCESRCR
jgi:hypothetical protein